MTQQYTLKGLLEACKVEIPIIQRDYAQGRSDEKTTSIRDKFLDAIHDHLATENPLTLDFVYGDAKDGVFLPLDGQQRLTTLVLLHWYAARREGVDDAEWDFLRKFSYATRVSARKFFEKLVGFTPTWGDGKLSEQIRDQHWFAAGWGNDPTIKSALVMLDAIDEKFADLAADKRLWHGLTAKGLVSFFFLPIDDMGMTDDLYVKMNSRGKPLTEFEHFKAVLEGHMKKLDTEGDKLSECFSRKMDADWTDMLWSFRAESGDPNTIDDEMVNYIRFVTDVIYVRDGGVRKKADEDILCIVDDLFGGDKSRDNALFLEQMLDIWYSKDTSDHFVGLFDEVYSKGAHEPGKIAVHILLGEGETVNVFRNSLRGRLSLNQFTWLYAVSVYLLNKGRIADGDRFRRLRTVNNLINASALREENMGTVFAQIDKIVRDGVVEYAPNGFAKAQIEEEQAKWVHIDKHPEDAALVYKLEDHPLLRGTIYIVGLDHLKLCDKFCALFGEGLDPLLRCRAVLAQGDYSQLVDDNLSGWGWSKYQFATAKDTATWSNLFHPSQAVRDEELNERTGRVLCELLEGLDAVSNETLQGVVDRYLKEAEEKGQFDWRYYMVRYAGYLMKNGNGCYSWRCVDGEEDPYLFFRLSGNTFRQRHWVALLHILQRKREDCTFLPTARHSCAGTRKHEIPLFLGKDGAERFFIQLRANGYEVYDNQWNSVRVVAIEQKDGVDTQDRIEVGLKLIDELLSA